MDQPKRGHREVALPILELHYYICLKKAVWNIGDCLKDPYFINGRRMYGITMLLLLLEVNFGHFNFEWEMKNEFHPILWFRLHCDAILRQWNRIGVEFYQGAKNTHIHFFIELLIRSRQQFITLREVWSPIIPLKSPLDFGEASR